METVITVMDTVMVTVMGTVIQIAETTLKTNKTTYKLHFVRSCIGFQCSSSNLDDRSHNRFQNRCHNLYNRFHNSFHNRQAADAAGNLLTAFKLVSNWFSHWCQRWRGN